jgi:hypothetical protein
LLLLIELVVQQLVEHIELELHFEVEIFVFGKLELVQQVDIEVDFESDIVVDILVAFEVDILVDIVVWEFQVFVLRHNSVNYEYYEDFFVH